MAAAATVETTAATAPAETPECYLGVVLAREAVDVSSQGDGVVEEVTVRLGDTVTAGAVLARLDTRELDHELAIEQTALQSAEAEQRRQQLDVERAVGEHKRRAALSELTSEAEIENARLLAEMAKARLAATVADVTRSKERIAQLEDRIAHAEVRAPFTGTVGRRYLDPGALVRPGTAVVRLLSSESLLARFAVPPEAVARLAAGTAVRVETDELGTVLTGRVEHLAPEIDAASQLVFVEAALDADAPVTAGLVARVSRAGEGVASCLGAGS